VYALVAEGYADTNMVCCHVRTYLDIIQASKDMTKDSHDHSHYEKSSQLSNEDPAKDLADLTKRRNGQRPEHQMFFLLFFLKIKHVLNNLGSL